MSKKFMLLFFSLFLVIGLTACNQEENNSSDNSSNNSTSRDVTVKTVADFQESTGLVKYFTIEDKNFSIPETVGEYANYLSQLGTVTLNDTGNSVEEEEIKANGISSMVAYLNVETEDSDYGAYIISIGDLEQGDNYYWNYYVNGEYASVGVSSYEIKNNDVFTFKLEKFG